jgi:hypothetical protein
LKVSGIGTLKSSAKPLVNVCRGEGAFLLTLKLRAECRNFANKKHRAKSNGKSC